LQIEAETVFFFKISFKRSRLRVINVPAFSSLFHRVAATGKPWLNPIPQDLTRGFSRFHGDFQGEIPHGKISQAKPELNGMIGNCIAFDKSPRTQLIPSKIFEIAPHMMRAQNGDDPQIPWLMI